MQFTALEPVLAPSDDLHSSVENIVLRLSKSKCFRSIYYPQASGYNPIPYKSILGYDIHSAVFNLAWLGCLVCWQFLGVRRNEQVNGRVAIILSKDIARRATASTPSTRKTSGLLIPLVLITLNTPHPLKTLQTMSSTTPQILNDNRTINSR